MLMMALVCFTVIHLIQGYESERTNVYKLKIQRVISFKITARYSTIAIATYTHNKQFQAKIESRIDDETGKQERMNRKYNSTNDLIQINKFLASSTYAIMIIANKLTNYKKVIKTNL